MKKEKNQLETLEQAFRDAGLRATHQRLEIFRELFVATDHPSAESLHRRLLGRIPTLSLDTVYRTLATLEAHGLANRVDSVENQARFEVVHEEHHHLVCRKCREIYDFQWPSVNDLPLPEDVLRWGRIDRKNVVVYGACQKCLEKGSKIR